VKEKDRSNYCDYFKFKDDQQKQSDKETAEMLWKKLVKKQ
jgi:hypothetical protein